VELNKQGVSDMIRPKYVVDFNRVKEIVVAMDKQMKANDFIPTEWLDELLQRTIATCDDYKISFKKKVFTRSQFDALTDVQKMEFVNAGNVIIEDKEPKEGHRR